VISGGAEEKRAVDPVCGIEMAPSEVAARLTLDGVEREFCSDECLRRFITK
jgi:YHS domain-containing protein